MTIVVNAVAAKMGGAANDLRVLAHELRRRNERHRFIFFVPTNQTALGQGLPENIEWRPTSAGERGWLRRLWWDQIGLRKKLKRERADVLYSFSDFAVLRCPVPQLLFVRNSTVFSDLYRQQVLAQKDLRFRLLYQLRRWLVCRSIKAADAVMIPSASMLEMLQRSVPMPAEKAIVNYYGAPDGQPAPVPSRDYSGVIRLLVPTYYADHKDFSTTLAAFRLLREKHGDRFRLVTTADPRWQLARLTSSWQQDLAAVEELARKGSLETRGLLSHSELLNLYSTCHVMCYPTLTESFGHALVEALQMGLPVVASAIPVNRELARDAALYFAPRDAEQMAEQIERIVNDTEFRRQLQEEGKENSRRFRWSEHMQRLLGELELLANRHAK